MVRILTQIFKYLNVLLMMVFTFSGICAVLKKNITRQGFQKACSWQRTVIFFFNLTNGILIFLHELGEGGLLTLFTAPQETMIFSFLKTFVLLWIALIVFRVSMDKLHPGTSPILTNSMIMLISIGMVMLWRIKPDSAERQMMWMIVGVVLINLEMYILRMKWVFRIPWYLWAALALILAVLPFLFPNPENGSLNWVYIAGISFQPSELIKPVLIFFFSTLFIRRQKLMPILVAALLTGALSLVLLIQNDLGMILIFCTMFLLMVYDYSQRDWILIGGAAGVLLAALVAYRFVGHVRVRVDIWLDPWSRIEDEGYQIAQSLFAIVGGKFMGTGLYQGMPYSIPYGWTDMIFSGICEEFGSIFAAMMVLTYLLLSLLMFNLVSRYENRQRRNMAMACSIITSIQTILIIGGVVKMIPLTGVTLPLVSYGGTSVLSTFLIFGIVQELFRSRTKLEQKVRAYDERQKMLGTIRTYYIPKNAARPGSGQPGDAADAPGNEAGAPAEGTKQGPADPSERPQQSGGDARNDEIRKPFNFRLPWED